MPRGQYDALRQAFDQAAGDLVPQGVVTYEKSA
jgi:hypothetical protein